jgi:DNA-binding XRE family transcriptional regulator
MKNKLREARKSKRFSQQLLAKESGVSRATITGIETGRIKNVMSETLIKLADALGMSVHDIFFTEAR